MPSFMIHLLAARLVDSQRSALYFVGSLAPDALASWQEKERTHLRDRPDREAALAELAGRSDPADDFAEGVLLHLYTDWQWDITQLRRYREAPGCLPDFAWVEPYRWEISLASAWLYWKHDWAPGLYQEMLAVPAQHYGPLEGIAPGEIHSLMAHSYAWLETHPGPPSGFYPPDCVEAFVRDIAKGYVLWRRDHPCSKS